MGRNMWLSERRAGEQCADHQFMQFRKGIERERQRTVVLELSRLRTTRKLFGHGCLLGGKRRVRHGQWQSGKQRADHQSM